MRSIPAMFLIAAGLLFSLEARALDGRVSKVLPQFIDLEGRHALSPSHFERDAYQVKLRENPALRKGLFFRVKWSAEPSDWTQVRLRVEARGMKGSVLQSRILEQSVRKHGWFGSWTTLKIDAEAYQGFGDLVAWRVTLWEDNVLLGEQKSFLW
ncbi:MAG: hypothetical protein H7X97_06140 [Opitutaceae bacterium]|nr:hypothetical protein [Verrucomicrobiales bacterium]